MIYLNGLRPVWAEIDLDALAQNIREVKRKVGDAPLLMAVVKANAYGHGAVASSKVFLDNGGDRLGVATTTEGVELRQNGVKAPILNLGYTPENQFESLIDNGISATVYNSAQALALNEAAKIIGKKVTAHIKVDTGLGRIGFLPSEEAVKEIVDISTLSNLIVEGIFTHFATADQLDKAYTHHQYQQFSSVVHELEKYIHIPIKHVSNSAAVIDLPEYNLDMVRPGSILYGYKPYEEINLGDLNLKPALTLKARLSNVKKVPPGFGVGYGLTYKTKRSSVIGTMPLGYADGLNRRLSNNGCVSVGGLKADFVGKIAMDQSMIDLTGHDGVDIGDEVVIFGKGGTQTAEDIALRIGSIVDEVLCSISRRVPRVYFKDGRIVEVKDYLINI